MDTLNTEWEDAERIRMEQELEAEIIEENAAWQQAQEWRDEAQ